MICLHKLRGDEIWLNPNLIALLEGGPQTVVTLTDGQRMIVSDPPEVVAREVRGYHADVVALAAARRDAPSAAPEVSPHLRAVPTADE